MEMAISPLMAVGVNGLEHILLFPNNLSNAVLFGYDYAAPQLVLNSVNYLPRCYSLSVRLNLGLVRQVIDAEFAYGKAKKKCVNLYLKRKKDHRSIPGMVNGEPVVMKHLH